MATDLTNKLWQIGPKIFCYIYIVAKLLNFMYLLHKYFIFILQNIAIKSKNFDEFGEKLPK